MKQHEKREGRLNWMKKKKSVKNVVFNLRKIDGPSVESKPV